MAEQSRVLAGGRVIIGFLKFLACLAGLALIYLVVAPWFEIGGVDAPAARKPTAMIGLNQGWNDYDTTRFHHSSQGTRILPLSWFMALEQPVLTPLPVGRLAKREYLGRFGFLHETPKPRSRERGAAGHPAGTGGAEYEAILRDRAEYDLPIGFAIEREFRAPYTDPPYARETPMVGLTCAACHTGRIEIKLDDGTTKAVRVDGGSAMIHIALFQKAVAQALFYTQLFPARFRRFSRNVLGESLPDDDPRVEELRKTLARYIELGLASQEYAKEHKLNGTEAGVSRTDALGLIGNRVFGVLAEENQVVTDAPVNFPHLWDTPWFDWVQYNGSIRTPMARNIGEALGVGGVVNLKDANFPLYESTVNVTNLAWMEDALGGHDLFEGLQPPSWADMVGKVLGGDVPAGSAYSINEERAGRGEELYKAHCIRCHLPPRKVLKEVTARSESPYFTKPDPGSGKQFLRLNVVDLDVIGTDPNQALNFYRRIAVAPEPSTGYERADAEQKQERVDAEKKRALDVAYPYWSRWVKEGYPEEGSFATISAEDGLFRVTSMVRRWQYTSHKLQLLPPDVVLQRLAAGREGDLRAQGRGLIVVASVGDVLHCRVFDVNGDQIFDTSEDDVRGKSPQIEALKKRLKDYGPDRRLTEADKGWIRDEVAAIFPIGAKFTSEADRARERMRWDRYRTVPPPLDLGDERAIIEGKDKDWVIKANLGYRARPHDGVWATPPYLHNGSVPNLYQMLVPASRRSKKFYLGSARFDPKHVGYETTQFPGAFLMDTTLPGNSNAGHEFRNLTLEELEETEWDGKSDREQRWADVLGVGAEQLAAMTPERRWALTREKTREKLERPRSRPVKGVLGPEFTEDERWQLVEYLKTL